MTNEAERMATDNVVPIRRSKKTAQTPEKTRESDKKWGPKVMALGFCVVPSLLLRAQQRLGLNPTQLAVLMQLLRLLVGERPKALPGEEKPSVTAWVSVPPSAALHQGTRDSRSCPAN